MLLTKKAKKQESSDYEKRLELLEELKEVQSDMDRTYANLSNVIDEELIDCLIYELNATQIRYKIILNQVKALNSTKDINIC